MAASKGHPMNMIKAKTKFFTKTSSEMFACKNCFQMLKGALCKL